MAKLLRRKSILVTAALLLISVPIVWASTPDDFCETAYNTANVGIKKMLAEIPTPKPSSFGKVLVKGGVPHPPARNQRYAEICWSYTLNGLAESELIKNTGEFVHLSPDHNGFWNVYFQIKNHLAYFTELNAKIAAMPKGEQSEAKIKAIEEFYGALKSKKTVNLKLWQPNMGSREPLAIKQVATVGFVPDKLFDAAMKNQPAETDLETAVKDFIGKYLLDEDKVHSFEGKNAEDGINDGLFKALSKQLSPAMGSKPLRPGETFVYDNKEYTPITFMREKMGFNPDDWVSIVATPETHDLALKALTESLKRGHAVPIGFPIFMDKINGEGPPMMYRAEKAGLFSPIYCNNGVCKVVDGGHEVLAVNGRIQPKKTQVSTTIVKNSWGETGRDVNGEVVPETEEDKRGYYFFTADYLGNSFKVHDNWDLVIHKDVANLKRFAGLKVEP